MKQIKRKAFRLKRTATGCFTLCTAMMIGNLQILAGSFDFYNWTSAFNGSASGYTFTNTSSPGTISGSSASNGFSNSSGTYGMPTAITSQQFTNEFDVSGQNVGASASFDFSSGYDWGSGGELILGNIHNYYEYTLSAWNFNGNPINVNTAWTVGTEYSSSAPGTMGYFSTSSTQESASGNSENFFVDDSSASANAGQGGVLTIDGLTNVGEIQLTLTSSTLGQNLQSDDFIIFNVGTPTPEPAAYGLCGAGLFVIGILRKRRQYLRKVQHTG
jgi:hypothetical protein